MQHDEYRTLMSLILVTIIAQLLMSMLILYMLDSKAVMTFIRRILARLS